MRLGRNTVLAVFAIAALAAVAGCQSYNFNPLGACIIQPGAKQVQFIDQGGPADILFVVDDSGSTDSKQQALAQNFGQFIELLAQAQAARVALGQQPFEFHIAVTTSSIFEADSSTNIRTTYPASFSGCTQGDAIANGPYPVGNFVSRGSNPKVIHFTSDLPWASWSLSSPLTDPIQQRIQWFVGTCPTDGSLCSASCASTCTGGNVEVGSCGSGEEQHLEGGLQAIQKMLNTKKGTSPGQPGVDASEFLHDGAKLVVVWVGDEDDCSNPSSGSATSSQPPGPLVLSGSPGADTCVADKAKPASQQVEYPVDRYQAFFQGLGRSFGAAFIVSATCANGTCTASTCTGANGMNGYAAGVRFLQLASDFRADGYSVVEGSVCDPFGQTLTEIATLVLPPDLLQLPSTPAANEVTLVRILNASGVPQGSICRQETTPGPVTDAATAGDWWFMSCTDANRPPAVVATPTECVYINHDTGNCNVTSGESYSAEYLGVIPPGGCSNPTTSYAPSQACATALAGSGSSSAADWWCFNAVSGAATGTCVCHAE